MFDRQAMIDRALFLLRIAEGYHQDGERSHALQCQSLDAARIHGESSAGSLAEAKKLRIEADQLLRQIEEMPTGGVVNG